MYNPILEMEYVFYSILVVFDLKLTNYTTFTKGAIGKNTKYIFSLEHINIVNKRCKKNALNSRSPHSRERTGSFNTALFYKTLKAIYLKLVSIWTLSP
jgi:hypothetical protein